MSPLNLFTIETRQLFEAMFILLAIMNHQGMGYDLTFVS